MTVDLVVGIRAQAIKDVLSALTGHELYRYRPKAFDGFIQYAMEQLIHDDVAKDWRETAEGAGSFIESMSQEQLRIHEALCDSQYIAGAKAGWNAGCIADPNEAQAQFEALIKSREGHLEGYADARADLAAAQQDFTSRIRSALNQ